jgi:AP-1 complex subunit gamma-1
LVNQNNNNIRYVALSTLCKLVNRDTQAIQRHRNTIVDCLKDPDISIRRRALDLIYALVTKANVVALVKELLNYLSLTTGDKEFKTDLTEKICVVIERFSPNEQWHIDTVIEVLSTAGAYAQPHVVTDLIALVSQTDELYAYSVHKLYDCLKKIKPNQFSLAQVAVWAVGEFGELLTSTEGAQAASIEGSDMKFAPVEEMAVLAIFKTLATHPSADVLIKQYILTALAKLIRRFTDSQGLIPSLISSFNTSIVVELQQRSIEYAALAANDHASFRPRILDRMPKFESKTKVLDAESSGSSESDESDEEEDAPTEPAVVAAETPVPETVVPDIMDIFGGAVANTVPDSNPAPVVAPVADGAVDLMSMFGQPAQPQPAQPVQPVAPVVQQQPDLMGLFDMGGMAPAPVVQPTQPPVYDSPNVSIFFSHNVNPATPHICETKALFRSKQANLSNFMFYCAFPKFLAHTMEQASGSELPLGGSVTQSFVITNSLHGKKRPVIRIRLNYLLNGQPQEETGQINSFP